MMAVFLVLIFLSLSVTAKEQERLRLNQGIQFSQARNVQFLVNEWTHTVKFKIPKEDKLFSEVSLCKYNYYSEKGCPISVEINSLIKHLNQDTSHMFQTIEGIVPLLHFNRQTKRNPILGFVGDLGSTLFGVATTSQLGVLRRHINIMTNTLNNITHVFSQSENDLFSFT